MKRIMFSTEAYYSIGRVEYPVRNGFVTVELPPFSGIVLRYRKKDEMVQG